MCCHTKFIPNMPTSRSVCAHREYQRLRPVPGVPFSIKKKAHSPCYARVCTAGGSLRDANTCRRGPVPLAPIVCSEVIQI